MEHSTISTSAPRAKLIQHNKLVRDKIPAEIEARGAFCTYRKLSPDEFRAALGEKHIEDANEVGELCAVPPDPEQRWRILEELADLQTVLNETQHFYGFTSLELNDAICRKMRTTGRFTERIFLMESWEESSK